MSSKKTRTYLHKVDREISFMRDWNVALALVCSNGFIVTILNLKHNIVYIFRPYLNLVLSGFKV